MGGDLRTRHHALTPRTPWTPWTPRRRHRAAVALLVAGLLSACVPTPEPGAFPAADELPAHPAGDASAAAGPAAPSAHPAAAASGAVLGARAGSIERHAREMTVRVRATGCGRFGTGSGFAVGDGMIVTNRHVVTDATTVTLNTWDGSSLDADVVGVDFSDDLALVHVDGRLPASATLAPSDPGPGTPVTVVGFPLGGEQVLARGEVVDYARLDRTDGPRVVRLSAEIWPGNSGGPVLDDEGRLLAVVFAIERATDHGLAVPVSQLRELLGGDVTRTAPTCG